MPRLNRILVYCFLAVLFLVSAILMFSTVEIDGEMFRGVFSYHLSVKPRESQLLEQHRVYVCGAVENEGYYYFKDGDTYFRTAHKAGVLTNSHFGYVGGVELESSVTVIFVAFTDTDGSVKSPLNINSPLFLTLAAQDALFPRSALDHIRDYLRIHGAFTGKQELKQLLGDTLYQITHFRIYIGQ